jgi:hypothetical protein
MAHGMTRREFAVAAGAATFAFGSKAQAEATSAKTLRFIAQSDLRVLDPIWTTAYITRIHGYMVFDTLFALDSKFEPHPQNWKLCPSFFTCGTPMASDAGAPALIGKRDFDKARS